MDMLISYKEKNTVSAQPPSLQPCYFELTNYNLVYSASYRIALSNAYRQALVSISHFRAEVATSSTQLAGQGTALVLLHTYMLVSSLLLMRSVSLAAKTLNADVCLVN